MTTLMKRNGETNVFSPFPSLFNDPFLKNWFGWETENTSEGGTLPAVNIAETTDAYELTVVAPGVSKNDFKVELENNRLVISGEKKEEKETKNGRAYLRKEFQYNSFVRSFTLGERQVNFEHIKAHYDNGLLYIHLPKSAEAKTKMARTIQIS